MMFGNNENTVIHLEINHSTINWSAKFKQDNILSCFEFKIVS